MKKTYLIPSCKMMTLKNEIIMMSIQGEGGDPGWGGEGSGTDAEANQYKVDVWSEE